MNFIKDTVFVSTDKPNSSCGDSLWTFSIFAHDQHWFSKARSFFLNASRVCEYYTRQANEMRELTIGQRLGNDHVGLIFDIWQYCLANYGVLMSGQDKYNVRVRVCQAG